MMVGTSAEGVEETMEGVVEGIAEGIVEEVGFLEKENFFLGATDARSSAMWLLMLSICCH